MRISMDEDGGGKPDVFAGLMAQFEPRAAASAKVAPSSDIGDAIQKKLSERGLDGVFNTDAFRMIQMSGDGAPETAVARIDKTAA